LTDNTLNSKSAKQTFALQGTGIPDPQSINFPNAGPLTYGVGSVTLTATATSGLPVSLALVSGPATLSGSTLTITGVGSVKVQATQSGNTNYSAAAPFLLSITVNPAALTVTDNNASVAAGAAIPTLTGTLTGVLGSDGIKAGYSTTAVQGSPAGNYPITPALIDPNSKLSNYSVSSTNGVLTIVPGPLMVLSLSPYTATAGAAGFTLTVSGESFASNSRVLWNGAVRATTYVSSTQLTAAILAADIATERTNLVTVANPAPNAATSAALPFAVVSTTPAATISGGWLAVAADGSGNHVLTLTGTDFVSSSTVKWNGASLTTSYVSPWQISAMVTAAEFTMRPVIATVVNPAGTSPGFALNSISTPIVVTVSPVSASVQTGATQQFTDTVTGTSNSSVNWNVNGAAGGNTTVGIISSSGRYTAPSSVPSPSTVTVTATSTAGSAKLSSATVTITAPPPPIVVTVSPLSASVQTGATKQFSATVTGTSNSSVNWSVNGAAGGNSTVGTVSSSGLYTAPASVPTPSTVSVTATSAADSTKAASATVTLSAAVGGFTSCAGAGLQTAGANLCLAKSSAPLSVNGGLHAVAFGNGLWVTVGSNGTIATSSDGANWTYGHPVPQPL
jgi:MBG domain (YGX type)